MENLSYALFWAGYMTVAISALGYVVLAVGVPLGRRAALTNAGVVSWPSPMLGMTDGAPGPAVSWMARLAALLLGSAVVTRGIAAGRPPYGNMWEYFLALGFGITVAYCIVEARFGQRVIGAFVLPIVAGLLTISEVWFPHQIEPLVPALRNNLLLGMHVAAMLTSYSALAVSFGAAVLYLLQGKANRYPRLPSADVADHVGHSAILFGFPILGLGIVLGAYWGNIAWARAWGWDPKETTALVSWLVYAGYLHARAIGNWRGRRAALLSIAGFSTILFNIFIVNFVIAGLHSYAGV